MEKLNVILFQFIIPIACSLSSGIFVKIIKKRRTLIGVLVLSFFFMFISLYIAYWQIPELVIVPKLEQQWKDQAILLCNKIHLNPILKRGNYCPEPNLVQKQSLVPGSQVFPNSDIVLYICIGQPVGDPLFGVKDK